MNPRRKMIFACTIFWTILGFVISTGANDGESISPPVSSSITPDSKLAQLPNIVVPQIGVLEERNDVRGASGSVPGQNDESFGNAGKGILVPVVSVIDDVSSKKINDDLKTPLVALLPAPLTTDPNKIPEISNLPILQYNDQSSPASKPEIRRSVTTGSADKKFYETMDVAEDIVFRPLFKIRPAAGKYSYPMRNNERKTISNYRRYNVDGYYRLPYDYYKSNYRDRYDYS